MMKELPALAVLVGSLRDAWRWQEARGGHVFAGADGVTFAWFNLSHTVSAVMLHPMLRGVSGMVNPKRGVA